jgi:aspartate racemase
LQRFLDAAGRARLNYVAQTYHGRITCFLIEEISRDQKKAIDDWHKIANGGLDVRSVPGTILSMWKEPHVQILAEQLKASLDDAQNN